jgi:hypothetical protein
MGNGARMDYLNRYERGKWRRFCFSPAGFGHTPLIFPETYPFKEEIVVNVVFTRKGGNAAVFLKGFKRHANQPELKFGSVTLA